MTPRPYRTPQTSGEAPLPAAATAAPPPIDSRQLLQGGRVIEIAHEGAIYRLQATRLGKLILTK